MFAKGVCCQKAHKCQEVCKNIKNTHGKYKLFYIFIWAIVGPNLGWFIFIIFVGRLMELQNGIVEIAKKQYNYFCLHIP